MPGPKVDNLEITDISKDSQPCELSEKALRAEPTYSTNRDALNGFTRELEALAAGTGMTVEQLLKVSETSAVHDERHEMALSLARKITFLKNRK